MYIHCRAKFLQPPFFKISRGHAQTSNVVIVLLFHPSKLGVFCLNFWIITPFLKLPSTMSTGISGEEMEKSSCSLGCIFEALRRAEN